MCSAKVFAQEIKFQSPIFVGILRAVKSEEVDGQSGGDTPSEVQKIKRGDFRNIIWKLFEDFEGVFLKDLPEGVHPRRMGMNSKFIWN